MTPDATGAGSSARPWQALLAIGVLALALRAAGLAAQPLIGDDLSVGATAHNFVELGLPEPTMWNHPRLRDLLVYLSLHAFGEGAWGLKAWSVLLGALSAVAVGALVLRLTRSLPAAAVAALFLALDPLHLDFSRQAINDVYLAALPVAAILALLRYRDGRRPAWLAVAGLLTGLGVATKWGAAFPVAAAAAVVLAQGLRELRSTRERAAEVALFAACLVALPLALYVLTFWPWLGRGHDLAELVRLHAAMAHETATHTGYAGTKLPGFPGEVVGAWRWFVQPIWYVDYMPAGHGVELPEGGFLLSGVANPLAWLATLPCAAWAALRWLRARDGAAGLLLLLFVAAYLPFVVVPRPIWTNSALAVVPFAAALVGWGAARLHERRRTLVRIWAGAALVLAALLLPAAAGVSTAPTDAAVSALVSPEALDPASHASP